MRVLAISGSLRAASINSALLRAALRLAPPGVAVQIFNGVGQLPLFNPDLEAQLPPQVIALHDAVAAADALLIASPEYAHGVTGCIKNTLDWLVSFEPFIEKPVAVLNASPRAHHADAALRETLKTMSAVIVEAASISIPLLGAQLSEDGMVQDHAVANAIAGALLALRACVSNMTTQNRDQSSNRDHHPITQSVQETAELTEAALNQFVAQATLENAEKDNEQEKTIHFSLNDAAMIINLLDNPAKPNDVLVTAFARFKQKETENGNRNSPTGTSTVRSSRPDNIL